MVEMCTLGWGDVMMGDSGVEGCWHERPCRSASCLPMFLVNYGLVLIITSEIELEIS